jgi:GT2 family glycosyltransferase
MGIQNNIDVSVIIVNYNTRQLTCDCIASVMEKTTGLTYEIIVVDNASSDGSVDFIKSRYSSVKMIASVQNEGFGKANNKGAERAAGRFLFLLNSDTVLINNAVKILMDAMEQHNNEVAGCCANLYTIEHKPNYSYSQYFPGLFRLLLYKSHLSAFIKNDTFNTTGDNKYVQVIIGAHLFIRKAVFEEMHGFDPAFFMYLEDSDLCLRIKKSGYKLLSVPAARIIHYQGKSSPIGSKLIMESKSFIYYFNKHGSSLTAGFYKGIEILFALLKMAACIFKPQRRKAYYELIRFLVI